MIKLLQLRKSLLLSCGLAVSAMASEPNTAPISLDMLEIDTASIEEFINDESLIELMSTTSFFGKELVTNGTAKSGTTGWSSISGFTRGVSTQTYSSATFTTENLPDGKSSSDIIFYGGAGGWTTGFTQESAGSYQSIYVTQSARETISEGTS